MATPAACVLAGHGNDDAVSAGFLGLVRIEGHVDTDGGEDGGGQCVLCMLYASG